MKRLILLGFVFFSILCSAQQDAQFTQYMFNNLYLTPAFAGVDGVTRFSAIHRSQWLGYQSSFGDGGAPTTTMVSFNTPIYKLRSGAGVYISRDQLGPRETASDTLAVSPFQGPLTETQNYPRSPAPWWKS